MPLVVAMIPDSAARRLADEQIGQLATVRFCETVETLLALVAAGGVDAVVSDLWDAHGVSVLPAFASLRRQVAHLPLILFFVPAPAALREVPDIIAAGHGLGIVLRNYEHLGLALRPLLQPPWVPGAGETLARHFVPLVPVPFRPFFLVSALKAGPALGVTAAASWSGFSRRTLERALRAAGLPSAGVVLGSCTALHAAWWLDVQGWSAKQVVTTMEFSHVSGLIRVLQRYFACSLKTLQEEGGFQSLLYRFETSLTAHPSPKSCLPSG